MVIANGETLPGDPASPNTAAEIFASGVDIITSGDHLWDQKEVYDLLQKEPRFLRPLNYPPRNPWTRLDDCRRSATGGGYECAGADLHAGSEQSLLVRAGRSRASAPDNPHHHWWTCMPKPLQRKLPWHACSMAK